MERLEGWPLSVILLVRCFLFWFGLSASEPIASADVRIFESPTVKLTLISSVNYDGLTVSNLARSGPFESFSGPGASYRFQSQKPYVSPNGELILAQVRWQQTIPLGASGDYSQAIALRWREKVLLGLDSPASPVRKAYARAANFDGNVIAGVRVSAIDTDHQLAGNYPVLRGQVGTWTRGGKFAALPGGDAYVNAMSHDGSVIVGQLCDTHENCEGLSPNDECWNDAPVMWSNGQLIRLPTFGTQRDFGSTALGVSGDGAVIVGSCECPHPTEPGKSSYRGVQWISRSLVPLSFFGSLDASTARAISANGNRIIGTAYQILGGGNRMPVMWEGGQVRAIGSLDEWTPLHISGDGRFVVGSRTSDGRAVIWDGSGLRVIDELVNQNGIAIPDGNILAFVTSISHDGSVIAGSFGFDQIWIVEFKGKPSLQIGSNGTNMVLRWPTNSSSAFILQSSTNFINWRWVPGFPPTVGDTFSISNNTVAGKTFFRLSMEAAPTVPTTPGGLTVTSGNGQNVVIWTAVSGASSYNLKHSTNSAGPFPIVANVSSVSYTNTALLNGTTYFYVVSAANDAGESSNSIPVAGTPNAPMTLINDFESYSQGSTVMFQRPSLSGSTSQFIVSNGSDTTSVTTNFPAGHPGAKVLRATWAFTTATNAWLRLTTGSPITKQNPVIDFRQVLQFDIYADKELKVALGCRETTNSVGTVIGSDGGAGGPIEWVGVGGGIGSPIPVKTVSAGTWTTLTFNLPVEFIRGFTGNGILFTSSGLGVLEHLVMVPTSNSGGIYNVYLDNFAVHHSNTP